MTPPTGCDLVMKGGITSGVIYPKLVAKLAERYRLHSIGGTSAGAIAAAGAAAAQLGAGAGTNVAAFEQLGQLPDELGERLNGGSRLRHLFQPAPALAPVFDVLVAALNRASGLGRALHVALALLCRFKLAAVIGALPGVLLLWVTAKAWATAAGIAAVGSVLAMLLAVALVAGGALLAAALALLRRLTRELPAHGFGLCPGAQVAAGEDAPLALTPWLHNLFNSLAGKPTGPQAAPLTFGELWAGRLRTGDAPLEIDPDVEHAIDLQMMTTALNLGRPFRLPFDHNDAYFDPEELSKYFPEGVNAWLRTHARASKTAEHASRAQRRTYLALPAAEDMPVVLAVRLSLSFPVLLSALPLYTVDRTLAANRGPDGATQFTRVWFSDGGICSNFPVHLFDSLLPDRPTFGVNLRAFHPEHPDQRVSLPEPLKNNQGIRTHVPELSTAPGLASIVGFLGAIVDTMQSWRDQMQLALPGFRDRIVHVAHRADEGGLNLDMPQAHIAALAAGGEQAGARLMDAFLAPGTAEAPSAWENHRRIRVRNTLSMLQTLADQVRAGRATPLTPTYDDVVLDGTPPSYPFAGGAGSAAAAQQFLAGLDALAAQLDAAGVDLAANAPRPTPELRIAPRT